jgi:hypothetical protein
MAEAEHGRLSACEPEQAAVMDRKVSDYAIMIASTGDPTNGTKRGGIGETISAAGAPASPKAVVPSGGPVGFRPSVRADQEIISSPAQGMEARLEAIGKKGSEVGWEGVRADWKAEASALTDPNMAVIACANVAKGSPEVARSAFSDWMTEHGKWSAEPLFVKDQAWLTTFPKGFRSGANVYASNSGLTELPEGFYAKGGLRVDECASLSGIPPHTEVGGTLDARNCPKLAFIGHGTVIGGDIDLRGCSGWDGRLPDDLKVAGKVRTDGHPEGIAIAKWRSAHPQGERADAIA